MAYPDTIAELAAELKALFERRRGRFDLADLCAACTLLRHGVGVARVKKPTMKPLGDNYMPYLIGTNFSHASNEFRWRAYKPVSNDGVIVHRFHKVASPNP